MTISAAPIESATNPQKIAMCISLARASRNMRKNTPAARRGTDAKAPDGTLAAKICRWRAIASAKYAIAP